MLGGDYEPCAGNARFGRLLERGNQECLARHPRQTGDELRLLEPENCLDGEVCVGSRYRLPTKRYSHQCRKLRQTAATCVSWVCPQGSSPISGIWRTSHSPSQPGMWVWCNSMKRSVHLSMSAFDFASKIA